MKKTAFVITFLLSGLWATGQNKWVQPVYWAFIQSDIPAWERTLDSLEGAYQHNPSDRLLLKLTRTQYGLAGYKIGVDSNEAGARYLEAAWRNSGLLLDAHPSWSSVMAMRSGLTGYKIALSPYKAPILGFKSIKYVNKALKSDSTCAIAWMEKGHIAFFASFMGYGYGKASRYYKKAVEYFEKKSMTKHNWLYINTCVHLGKAYAKSGKINKARAVYERILSIEPDFLWVKDELLPQLDEM